MCRPDFYGVEYEINPWMKVEQPADRARALQQWEALVAILQGVGADVARIDPAPGLPDMVFTANAGLVHQNRFFPSHFRHPQRRGETPLFERWFAEHGFETVDVYQPPDAAGAAFEGAGDALYCGETLFAGYLNRSDIQIHKHLGRFLDCRVVSLELVDPYFYHLDTCFCPLAPGQAVYFPGAFDAYGRRALQEGVSDLIEVDEEEARRFACNAVVVGRAVAANLGCDRLAEQLHARGFDVRQTDLSEFLKAGGAAKCLTLRLDGEEAAVW
jgi:N-dimethylarginine dimethylaminohydrolase